MKRLVLKLDLCDKKAHVALFVLAISMESYNVLVEIAGVVQNNHLLVKGHMNPQDTFPVFSF